MPRGKKDGWGGERQGTAGKGYVNRTDLMMDRAPAQVPAPQAAPGRAPMPQSVPQPYTRPDDIPTLTDPSGNQRPVTDGLDVGPGRSSAALGMLPSTPDATLPILRDLYRKTGSEHIRRMIAQQQFLER